MSDPRESHGHWARYWSSGYPTSLPNQYPNGYTGFIRDLWESIFDEMPDHGRLLDVGTGGGAVARLAFEHFKAHGIRGEIHAIDCVNIEPPPAFRRSSMMHFHPSTSVESTGFQTGYFDLVTSQFAIEYTDTRLSMAEMSRILKNNAEAVFLLHSDDSAIVDTAKRELGLIKLLWGEEGLVERVRRYLSLIDSVDRVPLAKAQSEVSRAYVNIRRSEHFQSFPDLLESAFESANTALEVDEHVSVSMRLSALEAKESEVKDRLARLNDLVIASLDERGIDSLISLAQSMGFKIKRNENFYHESGAILGRLLHLRKTP